MDAAERQVLDAVPIGLQIWEATGDGPRSLLLAYANPECGRQVGFDLEPLAGRPLVEIFPAAPADLLYEAAVAGEPRTLEFRYEGDERLPISWWRLKLAPYGERRALVSVVNITQDKAHERTLRASEQLNREILSGLQEGVVVVDTNARIVLCNAAAADLLGPPRSSSGARSARCPSTCWTTTAGCWPTSGCRWPVRCAGDETHGPDRALRPPRRAAAVGRGERQPAG